MDDLTAFLAARLDEDEAAARAAIGTPYPVPPGLGHGVWAAGDPSTGIQDKAAIYGDGMTIYDEGGHTTAQAAHIARHDPARVLLEVAAKRAILDLHYPGAAPHGAPEGMEICAGEESDGDTWEMATRWPCPTVQALAAIYSGHPDYRQEWKP
jgi:Family of unknown function (DUF6221)